MAVVASIQRNSKTIAIPAASGLQQITEDVTITSVDMARTLLTFSYRMTKGFRSSISPIYMTCHLLNATTIRFMVSVEETNPHKDREVSVEWQATEFAV